MPKNEKPDNDLRDPAAASPMAESAAASGPQVIAVDALLGPRREAVLLHNGESYRLRVTSNNKLILTK